MSVKESFIVYAYRIKGFVGLRMIEISSMQEGIKWMKKGNQIYFLGHTFFLCILLLCFNRHNNGTLPVTINPPTSFNPWLKFWSSHATYGESLLVPFNVLPIGIHRSTHSYFPLIEGVLQFIFCHFFLTTSNNSKWVPFSTDFTFEKNRKNHMVLN